TAASAPATAGGEVLAVVARRDAAVAGADDAKERVGRRVQAPAVEVEADRVGDRLDEEALPVDGVVAPQQPGVGPAPRPADRVQHRGQLAAQLRQEAGDVGGAHARLVLVQ